MREVRVWGEVDEGLIGLGWVEGWVRMRKEVEERVLG
jgi:hypothetical protein